MRCDKASGDNKGGTMISVPQHMQTCRTQMFASNGIEVIVTTLSVADLEFLEGDILKYARRKIVGVPRPLPVSKLRSDQSSVHNTNKKMKCYVEPVTVDH